MSDRTRPKSQSVQFVLALLFGPLGLFYSSVPGAVVLVLLAAVLWKDTDARGVMLVWPLAIATGFATVHRWNRRASSRTGSGTAAA